MSIIQSQIDALRQKKIANVTDADLDFIIENRKKFIYENGKFLSNLAERLLEKDPNFGIGPKETGTKQEPKYTIFVKGKRVEIVPPKEEYTYCDEIDLYSNDGNYIKIWCEAHVKFGLQDKILDIIKNDKYFLSNIAIPYKNPVTLEDIEILVKTIPGVCDFESIMENFYNDKESGYFLEHFRESDNKDHDKIIVIAKYTSTKVLEELLNKRMGTKAWFKIIENELENRK